MQIKLLKEVVSSIAGNSASSIVDLLYDKKNVNEFLIAKKLKLTINQTRNTLYKLADEGVVSFVRKKDTKKGGWYTYFWTLNTGKSLVKFKENLEKQLAELENQKNLKKQGRFFFCDNCQLEFNEEAALVNHYTCPECGEVLVLKDNNNEVIALEKSISKLADTLVLLNAELGIIFKQEEKSRVRKIKAEAVKKAKERSLRRAVLAKEKAKLYKKAKKPAVMNKKTDKSKKKNK